MSRTSDIARAEPYPVDATGLQLSLSEMAKKMREARIGEDSARIRGWAGKVLIDAERPQSVRAQAQVLLDAVRSRTVYMPDPVHAEYIVAPAGTLCLRPGLCVPAGDCDDLTIALGSCLLAVGIPVRIVKQTFDSGSQEHVLIEFQDENGLWVASDPSSDWPVGTKAVAASETYIDPMSSDTIAGVPEKNFVSIGAYPTGLGAIRQGVTIATSTNAPVGTGALINIIYPSTVIQLKDRLNAQAVVLNRYITTCADVESAFSSAWGLFYTQWQKYYATKVGWWGLGTQMDEAVAYEKDILNWQTAAKTNGCYGGPLLTVTDAPTPASESTKVLTRTLEVVGVSAAVVAVAVVAVKIADKIRPASSDKR